MFTFDLYLFKVHIKYICNKWHKNDSIYLYRILCIYLLLLIYLGICVLIYLLIIYFISYLVS